jgi:hypothetical protein
MEFNVTTRDLVIIGIVFIFREGLPWFMHKFFPVWMGDKLERRKTSEQIRNEEALYRREVENREFELKREIAERELELKREIAERDTIIENRNARTMEAMNNSIEKIVDGLSVMTLQMAVVSKEVVSMKMEQGEYFKAGRKAIQQIEGMSKSKKTTTRKP